MARLYTVIMRLLGNTTWQWDANTRLMWRWTHEQGWESREPTDRESLEMRYWQAIR